MTAILKVKDGNGNVIPIQAIKGDKGDKGEKGEKGDPTDVQQTTGQSTNAVMSQKAVTDEINALKTALIGVSDLIGGDA